MKKIFTLFIFSAILLVSPSLNAQTPHPWELGLNAGAAWLQSDVKMKKLGGGLGLTFGQMYCQTETSPIDWGWRFRYLNANTYGQDTKKSFGIMNNNMLNGVNDTTLNYYSNGGFVYQNYKTKLDELSLELLIGANRMRERTKVYPYIFGGVGITKAVTRMDQLNSNNIRYNYAAIDSAGTASASEINSQLSNIMDGNYESPSDGNLTPRWKFMPSLGLGLGFQVAKGFSIGLEHKITWSLNDVLDGQQWSGINTATGDNDKYHYSSVWLKFSFGRSAKTTTTTNSNVDNYTENTNVVSTPQKPKITLTSPASGAATVSQQTYTITAKISNINSVSDIAFTGNGASISDFTYNSSTQVFSAPVMLMNGANNYVITATNATGSSTANVGLVYNMPAPPVQTPAPVVNITSPAGNPYNTNSPVVSVNGTVTNINDAAQMQVTLNGAPFTGFTYSAATKGFIVNSTLVAGANTFVIKATNAAGSDSRSVTVIYQQNPPALTGPAPVITITNPSANPYSTAMNAVSVTATVANVSASSQISVTLNGGIVPFVFNASTQQLAMNATLMSGSNTLTISAANANGSDSKSRTIIYAPVVQPKPVITIINPGTSPSSTSMSIVPVNASVLNVTSVGQIVVSVNGAALPTSTLSFNPGNGQLNFNASLIPGANSVQVSATNVAGNDSKNITIIYTAQASVPAPIVTIIAPAGNPYNTGMNSVPVNATVMNVTSSSQVSVLLNGINVPFSFNGATHQVSMTATLMNGANTVTVSASNSGGSDSKTITIIYTQAQAIPAPVVSFITPATNPFTVSVGSTAVIASVLNVSAASQITVKLNGSNVPFNYNPASHMVDLNVNLILGVNSVSISATNASGSDSKAITIIYAQPAASPAPVVTITSPAANPFSTTTSSVTITATVLNVAGPGQINVSLNGAPSTAFLYNTVSKQLTFNASLVAGANTVAILATNASGSDSKSITIIYTAPVVTVPPPVVTITSPAANPFTTSLNAATINATVLNVTTASQISVKLNGALSTAFSFNAVSHQLVFNTSLVAGANTIVISATNTGGMDSKTLMINYIAPPTLLPPVVTITSPSVNPHIINLLTFNVIATVKNVTGASQIQVLVNGTPTTAFTYSSSTQILSLNATLHAGGNQVKITATNAAGSDSKSVTIKVVQTGTGTGADSAASPPSGNGPAKGGPGGSGATSIGLPGSTGSIGSSTAAAGPAITVTTPATTVVTATGSTYDVIATVDVLNQMNISVKINGVVSTGFTFNRGTKTLTVPVSLVTGTNTVLITANNSTGTSSKTITIVKP